MPQNQQIPAALRQYVEEEIFPQYDAFDAAHRRDHAEAVTQRALSLAKFYPEVRPDIVFAAAACHDLGLCEGRETHHIVSARIIRSDARLAAFFTPEEISLIADAAEDHRASLAHAPRTIYGRIIAEADRLIDGDTTLRRTVQYGLSHFPELDREGHWRRTLEHLLKKYADGGYLRLWIPESPNAEALARFRALIADRPRLRARFDEILSEEIAACSKLTNGQKDA